MKAFEDPIPNLAFATKVGSSQASDFGLDSLCNTKYFVIMAQRVVPTERIFARQDRYL